EAVDKVDEDDGVSVEDGEEEERVDLPAGHCQRRGEMVHGDGDVSVFREETSQDQPCVSDNNMVVLKDNRVHFDDSHGCFVGTKEDYCGYLG
ncbi:hypothetical protein A2U01_0078821, partial [Trifolium medium]|nr:hypothetical protein [Trifolium medium]